jgi:hypothetical protein
LHRCRSQLHRRRGIRLTAKPTYPPPPV